MVHLLALHDIGKFAPQFQNKVCTRGDEPPITGPYIIVIKCPPHTRG
jgi:CRISPR/Cas system-associated endonuclease Cas3-HD